DHGCGRKTTTVVVNVGGGADGEPPAAVPNSRRSWPPYPLNEAMDPRLLVHPRKVAPAIRRRTRPTTARAIERRWKGRGFMGLSDSCAESRTQGTTRRTLSR